MKDLKHLIYFENLLQEANNELVQRAISDGKKTIAYTCYHIPEVLLNVDNCFSVRLRAPRTGSMDIATYYLSSYLCGYSKALLERGIEGGYNFLSALIGSESCSTMNSSYIDRRFNLPSHVVNVPLRYTEEEVQKYAVDEVKSCIRFIEEQTGEKFDWDAYFSAMKIYNKQLEYELQKWDVNKTDYPQMTGATFWLYRLFYFHLSGGIDKIFIKTDKKVNKLMMKGYERKEHVSKEMRHRAIVWSCPANYYTSLANWLENCWGINVVMDMETMISYIMYDTEDKERSLATYAKTLQRTTMRKHTKGGYQNVLDELWRICDEYNADTVIMYNQISCKGMDGLNGIFDDQARERNINFIWVDQDLMDPRTVSRRDMREQIRVSKKAVKNGVTFSDYGSSLIKAYLEFPMVKSVQIIFITDFDRFNELGMICDKVRQTTDALNHILDNVLLDCNTCNLKSICDEVEGMKELHMKNAAKKQ